MSELTQREKAIRAAAYIDTDGSIGIRVSYAIKCTFTSTEAVIPYWLREEWGGSVCVQRPYNPNGKPAYRWDLVAKKAKLFLIEIEPYLMVKHDQAVLALELRQLQEPGYILTGTEKCSLWHPFYMQMKKLNQRGVVA